MLNGRNCVHPSAMSLKLLPRVLRYFVFEAGGVTTGYVKSYTVLYLPQYWTSF